MDHPLDQSEPARRLLIMSAREMAKRMRVRIEVGESFDKDEVLAISVGIDVLTDGRASYVAYWWDNNYRGVLLDYGTLGET
jgi:hypothetical protein